MTVFTFPTGNLVPGDYCFPVSFPLPRGIPSSMFFKQTHGDRKPKAQVKYSLCCKLKVNHGDDPKYKQILIIREEDANFSANISKESETKVTTWCCVDQGRSKIEVQFDKNTYLPNEYVRSRVALDNSQCQLNMKHVRLAVEQVIHIHAQGHNYSDTITLVHKDESGVNAKFIDKVHKELEVDLGKIKYPAPSHKKKMGKQVPVSLEDAFMISQL